MVRRLKIREGLLEQIDEDIARFVEKKAAKSKSKDTRQTYRTSLRRFFGWVGVRPREFVKMRDWREKVEAYFESKSVRDLAPMTKVIYVTVIKNYLRRLGLTADPEFWRDIKPRARAVSREKVFTDEQLKALMRVLPLNGRTLLATMLSSGTRVSEALSIRVGDIEFDQEPVKVFLRAEATKNRLARTAFVSNEAAEHLKILTAGKSAEDFVFVSQKGAKLGRASAEQLFWKGLDKIGVKEQFDPRTHRRLYRLHSLRKLFFTRGCNVVPRPIVEMLIGHEAGLAEAYLRPTENELKAAYLKIEPLVTIEHGERFVTSQIEALQENGKSKEARILELESRVRELESIIRGSGQTEERLKEMARILGPDGGERVIRVVQELTEFQESPAGKAILAKLFGKEPKKKR